MISANISVPFSSTHLERVLVLHRLWKAGILGHIEGCSLGNQKVVSISHQILLRREMRNKRRSFSRKALRLFYFLNRKGGRCSRFIQSTPLPPLRRSALCGSRRRWTPFSVTQRRMVVFPVLFFSRLRYLEADRRYLERLDGPAVFLRRKMKRGAGSQQLRDRSCDCGGDGETRVTTCGRGERVKSTK